MLYQGASFDYFFTYENCSFHLSDFINVALEEPLDVPSRWYYLPADLIHALVAHQAQKATLGLGEGGEEALVLGYQSGYHELLARDEGLEPFSPFRFLGLRASYLADSKKLKLEELNLIDVVSLHPWRWYHSQLSWRVGVWAEDTLENLRCRNCQRLVASGKVGLSFGDSTWIASLLFGAREELTDSAAHLLSYEAIFGINVGGLNVRSFKTLVSFEGRHNLDKIKILMTNVVNLGVNYSWIPDWELRLNWQSAYVGTSYELAGERGSLDLGYYF